MTNDILELDLEGHGWQVAAGLEPFLRDVLSPRARDLAELPGAEVVKHNRVRTVVRCPAPGGALYVKRYRARGARMVADVARGSPARREWRALLRFADAGIPCPEPVVLGEERRGGLVRFPPRR